MPGDDHKKCVSGFVLDGLKRGISSHNTGAQSVDTVGTRMGSRKGGSFDTMSYDDLQRAVGVSDPRTDLDGAYELMAAIDRKEAEESDSDMKERYYQLGNTLERKMRSMDTGSSFMGSRKGARNLPDFIDDDIEKELNDIAMKEFGKPYEELGQEESEQVHNIYEQG